MPTALLLGCDLLSNFSIFDIENSTSLIQRKFNIGYNRAGRLMDQLEIIGIVGSAQESKPRDVYVSDEYQLKMILGNINGKNKQIDYVKNTYADEIEKRRKEIQAEIELKEEQEKIMMLELEKQIVDNIDSASARYRRIRMVPIGRCRRKSQIKY